MRNRWSFLDSLSLSLSLSFSLSLSLSLSLYIYIKELRKLNCTWRAAILLKRILWWLIQVQISSMVLFWPDLCIVRTLEKIKVYLLVDRGTVHNDAELRVSTNSSPVTQWHRLCLGFISASCRGNHVITMAWTSFLYQGPTFLEELSGLHRSQYW